MTQIDIIKRITYHISIGYSIFDNGSLVLNVIGGKIMAFGLKTEFLKFKQMK